MANALTDHNATIIAQEAMIALRNRTVLANLVQRDYEEEIKSYGDKVKVPKFGTFTANDKGATANVTVQDATSTSATITLNKHKEVTFLIYDVERAFSRNDLLQGYMESAIQAIAEQVDTDIFALYAGLSKQEGAAGTDLDEDNVLAARKLLVEGKAPKDGNWFLVIDPKDYNALLKVDRFTSAEKIGKAGAIAEGALGKLHGFNVFESQLAPVVAGTPDSTHGLAFHKWAVGLAVRPMEEDGNGMGVLQRTISDPESGLAIRVTMSYNPDKLAVQVTLDLLYGVAELRDELAVDMLS